MKTFEYRAWIHWARGKWGRLNFQHIGQRSRKKKHSDKVAHSNLFMCSHKSSYFNVLKINPWFVCSNVTYAQSFGWIILLVLVVLMLTGLGLQPGTTIFSWFYNSFICSLSDIATRSTCQAFGNAYWTWRNI